MFQGQLTADSLFYVIYLLGTVPADVLAFATFSRDSFL
jgi:hypothetical protein